MKNDDGTLGFPDINRNPSEDDMSTTGGQRDPFDIALSSGAYALNALSEEEKLEFEAHLVESHTTRNEVTEMAETAALLGLSVTPVTPSPEMKRNLMAMLASTPQLPKQTPAELNAELSIALGRESPAAIDQTPATAVPVFEAMPPVESQATAASAPPAELSERAKTKAQARWFNRPIMALTAVAAALVLIVGGSSVVNLVNDATYQQQQADQLAQITSAEDMQQTVAVVSTGGTATLMWSEELGKSVVVADGLTELSRDQTYELWYITADGTPTAAGLFDVDGSDSVWRVLDGEMQAGVTVGVTVEPKGGSEQPTTDPIVAISSAA
jgi:anti-sigma-K factor RskA